LSEIPQSAPPAGATTTAGGPAVTAPPSTRLQSIRSAARAAIVPVTAAIWAALGTFWSIFAWYHQEVVVPSAAPVNLTTEVTVQEAGTGHTRSGSGDEKLDAIQIAVTANNVSTKPIHLLANYWDAWGGKISPRANGADGAAWLKGVNAAQVDQDKNGQLHYALSGRYYDVSQFERVGWGNLFPTTYVLQPKETISASALFYVPAGVYDMVHVEVHIPTTERPNVALMFGVDATSVQPRIFRIAPDGTRQQVTAQSDIAPLKIQETQAFREISLGNSGETPPGAAEAEAKSAPPPDE
jgi:hypothetical protein